MHGILCNSRWRLIPVLALGLAACVADGTAPNAGRGRLSLSLSTQRPATSTTASSVLLAGDSTVIVLGLDTVIVRGVDLVLRKIELKRVEATDCADEEPEGANNDGQHEAQDNDEVCEEVEAGPVLVTLPLGAAATEALVDVSAPAGQYDRLEFKIHAPKGDPADLAFIAAHPEFQDVSIRVTGTFSHAGARSDFKYVSDLEASQEVVIDPPLTVAAGGTASVTLRFDISGWFLNAAGDGLIDPASANAPGPNAELVRKNIQRSINAFEDDDHDGHDDDDPEDDHDGGHDSGEGGGDG